MARFYGSVQGSRGEAHRLGHSDVTTIAASWNGGVQTTMYRGDDGVPMVRLETIRWHGRGEATLLFDGSLATLQAGAGPGGVVVARAEHFQKAS